MNPSVILRGVVVAVIVGGWFLLRHFKPEWAQVLIWPWATMREEHGWWVPAVGGGLWGALLCSFLVTMYWPGRKRYGDEAMALGCVGVAAMCVGVILVVLLLGIVFRWTGVVNVISYMAMMLALLIMPQFYWAKFQDWRKGRRGMRP